MTHLDLFSGIGGFSLAAQWVWGEEHEVVVFCEMDPFCQKVIKKHWPGVPIVPDIHDLKGDEYGEIDLLTGGFPCQPYSVAGKRKGSEDDRALGPEMFRVIQEARPRWILGENVAGIVKMELDTVLSDLESEGYTCQAFIIPACATDAPHRRDRVWILANAECVGRRGRRDEDAQRQDGPLQTSRSGSGKEQGILADAIGSTVRGGGTIREGNGQGREPAKAERESLQLRYGETHSGVTKQGGQNVANAHIAGLEGQESARRDGGESGLSAKCCLWLPEPSVGRVANGIPRRVDRLRALGNAIVPQVAAEIMQAIKDTI